jgi:tRNA (cytidine/uridine-2'-O-)-methyltransferase
MTKYAHRLLGNPALNIVLYEPEIPANTGNIARTCGAAQLRLHLIHPLGFRTDDRHLKRAGLDYWHEVDIHHHQSFHAFQDFLNDQGHAGRVIGFSRHSNKLYTEAKLDRGGYLLFGPETRGLPKTVMECFPCYRVPIWGQVRSLNLSTTVGIVSYHYLYDMELF